MSIKARLARAIKLNPLAIRIAALRFSPMGIAGRSKHYQRFVVAGYQRSGSTMLHALLAAHPQAHCYGEAYNFSYPMLWTPGYDNENPWLTAIRNETPADFLRYFIYRGYQPHIRAVGFKLFPEHAKNPRFNELAENLMGDPGVKFIHLVRDNKLAMHLSQVRAQNTGVWALQKGKRQADGAVYLDLAECAAGLAALEQQEAFFRERLADREHLPVSYERLTDDNGDQYQRIQEYLGLDAEPMQPRTAKQRTAPLHEAIANFQELREYFQGTPMARYFEL